MTETHVILYTDGSCRPNPGWGGWGFHGYIYYNEPQKRGSGCKDGTPTKTGYIPGTSKTLDITLTCYIDGYGAEGALPVATNNTAELIAAIRALQVIQSEEARSYMEDRLASVMVFADSQYVCQAVNEWGPIRRQKGWRNDRGDEMSNAHLLESLLTLVDRIRQGGVELNFAWVPAHQKGEYLGNDIADQHSNRGRVMAMNQRYGETQQEHIRFSPPQGYWTQSFDTDPMFCQPQWFFLGRDEPLQVEGQYVYYLAETGHKNDLLHRSNPSASYTVLITPTLNPQLDVIKQAMHQLGRDLVTQGPIRVRLNNLWSPEPLQDYHTSGLTTFLRDSKTQQIRTYNDVPVAEEVKPAYLTYQGIDQFDALRVLLEQYLQGSSKTLHVTDITDTLFDFKTKAKTNVTVCELKKSITSTTHTHVVTAGYLMEGQIEPVELKLVIGVDLPKRNALAKLADPSIQVKVITWPESPYAIRYATVIHHQQSVALWVGLFTAIKIVRKAE